MCDLVSLDCTVASGTGWPIALWDLIFTLALSVGLIIILELAIGSGRTGRSVGGDNLFIISASIGFIGSVIVGWIPYWVVIFIALIIALVLIPPWGGRGH